VEKSSSTDSTLVEIAWQTDTDTICVDTVAALCSECLSIPNDTVFCNGMTQLYLFNFVNDSDNPVNAISIIETDPVTGDELLNSQTHYLGETVGIGEEYQNFIPVEFIDSNEDGELCFDIVARYLIEGEIPIICCYVTHCITTAVCPDGSEERCVEGDVDEVPSCPLEADKPVCGCDGETYVNRCFVSAAGIITWTGGPCPGTPPIIPDWPIDRIDFEDGIVVIEAEFPTIPNWYGFILQRLRPTDDTWWQVNTLLPGDAGRITIQDNNPVVGEQRYRIMAVSNTGQPSVTAPATVEVPVMRPSISVSPNPASGEFYLTSDVEGLAEVILISTTGKAGESQMVEFAGSPVRVELGRRPSGVYSVFVRFADGRTGVKRVVVR